MSTYANLYLFSPYGGGTGYSTYDSSGGEIPFNSYDITGFTYTTQSVTIGNRSTNVVFSLTAQTEGTYFVNFMCAPANPSVDGYNIYVNNGAVSNTGFFSRTGNNAGGQNTGQICGSIFLNLKVGDNFYLFQQTPDGGKKQFLQPALDPVVILASMTVVLIPPTSPYCYAISDSGNTTATGFDSTIPVDVSSNVEFTSFISSTLTNSNSDFGSSTNIKVSDDSSLEGIYLAVFTTTVYNTNDTNLYNNEASSQSDSPGEFYLDAAGLPQYFNLNLNESPTFNSCFYSKIIGGDFQNQTNVKRNENGTYEYEITQNSSPQVYGLTIMNLATNDEINLQAAGGGFKNYLQIFNSDSTSYNNASLTFFKLPSPNYFYGWSTSQQTVGLNESFAYDNNNTIVGGKFTLSNNIITINTTMTALFMFTIAIAQSEDMTANSGYSPVINLSVGNDDVGYKTFYHTNQYTYYPDNTFSVTGSFVTEITSTGQFVYLANSNLASTNISITTATTPSSSLKSTQFPISPVNVSLVIIEL